MIIPVVQPQSKSATLFFPELLKILENQWPKLTFFRSLSPRLENIPVFYLGCKIVGSKALSWAAKYLAQKFCLLSVSKANLYWLRLSDFLLLSPIQHIRLSFWAPKMACFYKQEYQPSCSYFCSPELRAWANYYVYTMILGNLQNIGLKKETWKLSCMSPNRKKSSLWLLVEHRCFTLLLNPKNSKQLLLFDGFRAPIFHKYGPLGDRQVKQIHSVCTPRSTHTCEKCHISFSARPPVFLVSKWLWCFN